MALCVCTPSLVRASMQVHARDGWEPLSTGDCMEQGSGNTASVPPPSLARKLFLPQALISARLSGGTRKARCPEREGWVQRISTKGKSPAVTTQLCTQLACAKRDQPPSRSAERSGGDNRHTAVRRPARTAGTLLRRRHNEPFKCPVLQRTLLRH